MHLFLINKKGNSFEFSLHGEQPKITVSIPPAPLIRLRTAIAEQKAALLKREEPGGEIDQVTDRAHEKLSGDHPEVPKAFSKLAPEKEFRFYLRRFFEQENRGRFYNYFDNELPGHEQDSIAAVFSELIAVFGEKVVPWPREKRIALFYDDEFTCGARPYSIFRCFYALFPGNPRHLDYWFDPLHQFHIFYDFEHHAKNPASDRLAAYFKTLKATTARRLVILNPVTSRPGEIKMERFRVQTIKEKLVPNALVDTDRKTLLHEIESGKYDILFSYSHYTSARNPDENGRFTFGYQERSVPQKYWAEFAALQNRQPWEALYDWLLEEDLIQDGFGEHARQLFAIPLQFAKDLNFPRKKFPGFFEITPRELTASLNRGGIKNLVFLHCNGYGDDFPGIATPETPGHAFSQSKIINIGGPRAVPVQSAITILEKFLNIEAG